MSPSALTGEESKQFLVVLSQTILCVRAALTAAVVQRQHRLPGDPCRVAQRTGSRRSSARIPGRFYCRRRSVIR